MKILFLVNDFGNGNIVRCRPLIEELSKKNDVSVFSSKGKLDYLSCGIQKYEKKHKYKSFYSLKNIVFYISNCIQLAKLLMRIRPNRIIIDSDYHIFFFAFFFRKKIFSINNSFYVVRNSLKEKVCFSLFFEVCDYLFQKIVCFRVVVPVISRKTISPCVGKFYFFPLWTTIKPGGRDNGDVLIIEGGSNLQVTSSEYKRLLQGGELGQRKIVIIGLNNTSEMNNDKIIFKNFVGNIQNDVRESGLLVIRGGLSSISDAIGSGLPTIIIPLKGHLEQMINAKLAKREFGFHVIENIQELPLMISKYIEGSMSFETRKTSSENNIVKLCDFLGS